METIILGSCVALATGISAYSIWRTRQLTEEVTSQTNVISSVRNDVENKAWLQNKSYSEDLAERQKIFTTKVTEHDKHLAQLLATVTAQNHTLDGSLNSLKSYISNTKQELSSVIDGKFSKNKETLGNMRDEIYSLRGELRDLDNKKVNVTTNTAEVETLYGELHELSKALNDRIDALAISVNKIGIDRLAKGEREIYEQLQLGIKQKEIAKRLHTTEQRVSKVKKDLIAKGLLDQ